MRDLLRELRQIMPLQPTAGYGQRSPSLYPSPGVKQ
jgi:hypothetical protein